MTDWRVTPRRLAPRSNDWSNSSAFIDSYLLLPGTADRDDPDPLLPVGHHGRPMLAVDLADHQPPRLVRCPRGDLDVHRVLPQHLRFGEVDSVFRLVGRTLARIELELHPSRPFA